MVADPGVFSVPPLRSAGKVSPSDSGRAAALGWLREMPGSIIQALRAEFWNFGHETRVWGFPQPTIAPPRRWRPASARPSSAEGGAKCPSSTRRLAPGLSRPARAPRGASMQLQISTRIAAVSCSFVATCISSGFQRFFLERQLFGSAFSRSVLPVTVPLWLCRPGAGGFAPGRCRQHRDLDCPG